MMKWNWEKDWIVIVAIIGVSCFGGIIAIICYATGVWVPQQDAEIIEFGVCLNNSQYTPVQSLPTDAHQFYWCGIVEGTTYRTGELYLYYENNVIFQQNIKVQPGHFFLPVSTNQFDIFQPGRYRADIGAERQILAKTEFSVIGQKSS
ncbi:MAG: hypothetical protein U0350_26930 [Caldilineaceae bacterium]